MFTISEHMHVPGVLEGGNHLLGNLLPLSFLHTVGTTMMAVHAVSLKAGKRGK